MESGVNEKSRQAFEVPAPHVVITCPSCATSFAIETAAVAALKTPRFHCSRCDDVFIMRDAPRATGFQLQSLSGRSSESSYRTPWHTDAKRAPASDPLLKSSDFSLGSSIPGVSSRLDDDRSDGVRSVVTDASTCSEGWAAAEDEAREPQNSSDTLSSNRFMISEPAAVAEAPPSPSSQETPPPRRFVLSDSPTTNASATEKANQPGARSIRTEQARVTPRQRPDSRHLEATVHSGRLSARTQSLLSMSTPILGSLLFTLALSYSARLSPQSIDAIANIAIPSFAKGSVRELPPPNLSVRGLALSFQKTRNRETVAVVSGAVRNDAGQSFDGVEIEALGFNERGEVILSSRAPLRSALANQKISQLSISAIANIQEGGTAQGDSIVPREAVPFSVALLNAKQHEGQEGEPAEEVDPSKIRYFSARIFSITQGK